MSPQCCSRPKGAWTGVPGTGEDKEKGKAKALGSRPRFSSSQLVCELYPVNKCISFSIALTPSSGMELGYSRCYKKKKNGQPFLKLGTEYLYK